MRTTFSQQEIMDLKKNPCVFACTEKSIYYTYEFKKYALEIYAQGVTPKEIWKRSGFDITKWKKDYFALTMRDWRRIVKRGGIEGLHNTGGLPYDRGPKNTDKDTIRRLELQVKYLQAENSFLAQLRAKRAERNSGRMKSTRSSKS
jgi:hypothetical protein